MNVYQVCQLCECKDVLVPNCQRYWIFQTQLEPGEYIFNISRKDGKSFSIAVNVNYMGVFTLDTDLLPEGFINPYGSKYNIILNEIGGVYNNNRYRFLFGDKSYPCLNIEVLDNTPVNFIYDGGYIIDDSHFICCCRDCEEIKCQLLTDTCKDQ